MAPDRRDLPRVHLFQPRVEHYRIPLWDGLVELGRGRYELTVFGPLDDGAAFGGGRRPYLRPARQVLVGRGRFHLLRWPDLAAIVRRDRPAAVVVGANLRNLSHWHLRRACRDVDVALIAHAKVHSTGGLPRRLTDALKRRFFQHFDLVVCYGEQSRAELVALGFPPARVRVAHNTVDTRRIFDDGDAIRQRGAELRHAAGLDDALVVLCVGRMDADKRQRDLLAALARLRAGGLDVHVVLVGGGPDLDDIRRQASEIDADHVVVTGRVGEGDDYAWIATADVCVFPGAVGLAVNQALALGTPTVIADEPGADAELVEHDRTGWRFPRGDVAALADRVAWVLSPEAGAAVDEVRERAIALLRDELTIDNMVAVFDDAITQGIHLHRSQREGSLP